MTETLPNLPEPAAPVNPPCDWCKRRPAQRYEVAPAMWGARRGARVMVKHAIEAYACKRHREIFDKQKQEIADRKSGEKKTVIRERA